METNSGSKHHDEVNAPAQRDVTTGGGGGTSGSKGTQSYPTPASDDSQSGSGSSSGSKGSQSYPSHGE